MAALVKLQGPEICWQPCMRLTFFVHWYCCSCAGALPGLPFAAVWVSLLLSCWLAGGAVTADVGRVATRHVWTRLLTRLAVAAGAGRRGLYVSWLVVLQQRAPAAACTRTENSLNRMLRPFRWNGSQVRDN
jgi:hypothetical protein